MSSPQVRSLSSLGYPRSNCSLRMFSLLVAATPSALTATTRTRIAMSQGRRAGRRWHVPSVEVSSLLSRLESRLCSITDVITHFIRAKAQMRRPQCLRKLQQARNTLHLCARVRRHRSQLCLMLTQLSQIRTALIPFNHLQLDSIVPRKSRGQVTRHPIHRFFAARIASWTSLSTYPPHNSLLLHLLRSCRCHIAFL